MQLTAMRDSDPHSYTLSGSTNPATVEQNHIPDVVPQLKQTAAAGPGKLQEKNSSIPRPCPFCSTIKTLNVHGHIVLKHKNEEVVQHAMKLPEPEREGHLAV